MKESDFDKEIEVEVIPDDNEEDDRIENLFGPFNGVFPHSVEDLTTKMADSQRLPSNVNTLEDDFVCPEELGEQCGLLNSNDSTCSVCGFQRPPKGFDDPNTKKHRKRKLKDKIEQEKARLRAENR